MGEEDRWVRGRERRRGLVMYRTPGIQKGPVDSHTRRQRGRVRMGEEDEGGQGTLRGGDILQVSQLKQLCSGRSGPVHYTEGIRRKEGKEGGREEGSCNLAPCSVPLLRSELERQTVSVQAECLRQQRQTQQLESRDKEPQFCRNKKLPGRTKGGEKSTQTKEENSASTPYL
ncbi:Hypothetical predicted protein [Xyrichtys novacula]|uniref:Uncharacterized protein n=1 Tax=Xyrichtys novacula TaxID=13765 RepID=A0AAV1GR15_XYRNO|nr:Hypothetical predicted protein [Xyrichtys novacula]